MQTPSGSLRFSEIDQFRGLAILGMVLANFMGHIRSIPPFLKHAPDIGYTVIDLIAPMFIFAIGLTYGASYTRRVMRDGQGKTISHILVRYLALIGIGSLISYGEIKFNENTTGVNWGVLQAIGVAGVLTLLFIRLPLIWRFLSGFVLLGGYQFMLDHFWLQSVLQSPHGGIEGSLSWTALMIFCTCLSEIYFDPKHKKLFPLISGVFILLGLILAFYNPISKNRVSDSYILISLGLSAIVFWVIAIIPDRIRIRWKLLERWGKNPLGLYFLHYLILGLYVLPGVDAWYAGAPIWLTILQAAFLIGIMDIVARIMTNRGWFIAL
jgi:predicted acyltransferase